LFVHAEVDVFKEVEAEPFVEGFFGDGAAVGGPGFVEGGAGGVGEAVRPVLLIGRIGRKIENSVR